jgi:hypothetical protein
VLNAIITLAALACVLANLSGSVTGVIPVLAGECAAISIKFQGFGSTSFFYIRHVPVSSSILHCAECNNHPGSPGMCAGILAYRKHTIMVRAP